MSRFLSLLGVLLISTGVFGLSYTYTKDHRSAKSLSEYCDIEFRTSFTEEGNLEGAVFTLYDYRYDRAHLEGRLVLYTDGSPWEMTAKVRQRALSFDDKKHPLQRENKLFAQFPRSSLSSLKKAGNVRLRFYYDNGQVIDLPLAPGELARWKMQME